MFIHLKNKFPHLIHYWEKYEALQERKKIPAKTVLLGEGNISQKYFFIEKGCVRVWFNNSGKDTTVQFFFENEGLASIESFRKNTPGMFTIETIEPSIICEIKKKDVLELIKDLEHDACFLSTLLDISLERQNHYMNEFISRIRDTATERYKNLLLTNPKIIQRVPQHYIASYLGITSVHLSRIKNALQKG